MSDPIEDRIRQIEAMIGEAAKVAHRHRMKTVGIAHLLYVFAGSSEGQAIIEEAGGNPRRMRTFLENGFNQQSVTGLHAGGTEFDSTLQEVTQRRFRKARDNGRVPQLSEFFQEILRLNDRCDLTHLAMEIGGVIESAAEPIDDGDLIDDDAGPVDLPEDEAAFTNAVNSAMEGMEAGPEEGENQEGASAAPETAAPNTEVDEHAKAVNEAIRDLSKLVQLNRIDPVIGRGAEISAVVDSISRKRKTSAVLVGEAGVGKTAVAEGLAIFLASPEAPETLKARPVLEVALSDLVAGSRFRGDFEARVRALVTIAKKRNAIIFMDEIHLMVGAGAATGKGGMDAANILKPALARGEITILGATTPAELREFRKDAALMRRFEIIQINEPTAEETRRIVDEAIVTFDRFHNVEYSDAMLDLTVSLADRHLPAMCFPDKAFSVIDTACVLARRRGDQKVIADDVRKSIERCGGSRLTPPDAAMRAKLKDLPKRLSSTVMGQTAAVDAAVKAARRSILGTRRGGVAGSYLFNGPSGSGKSQMAYGLADALGYPLVRIDMSELMEKHAVSRLIGAPPGYVGFDQDGLLVQAGDKYRDLVLLLDEVEKAHPDVFDILLQILDYGMFRSADGRLISLQRAHVIMSANIGAAAGEKSALGFGRTTDSKEVAETEISRTFRPELLKRIQHKVQFDPLDTGIFAPIIAKEFVREAQEYADRGMKIIFDDTLIAWIGGAMGTKKSDGRSIQERISEMVHEPLVDHFLENEDCMEARVSVKEGSLIIA